MKDTIDTPLGEAGPALRAVLVDLAERYKATEWRPCLDAETTLRDWMESGVDVSLP